MTNKTETSRNTPTLPIVGTFRKKPVVIDAYRLPLADEPVSEMFHDWCEKVGFENFESDRDEGMMIQTLEGDMRAEPGDWIIKGVKGEFYPCKPDIFAATYEPADGGIDLEAADFSDALLWLKEGQRVARKGWNGKGQWVEVVKTNELAFFSDHEKLTGYPVVQHLGLKNVQGQFVPGWTPSTGDLMATDWQVYEAQPVSRAEQSVSGIPPHQQRVFDERADLDERLTKLNAFIDGKTFCALPVDEQARLQEQANHMASYLDVLARRINHF